MFLEFGILVQTNYIIPGFTVCGIKPIRFTEAIMDSTINVEVIKMKKIVAVILTSLLLMSLAAGCGSKVETPAPKPGSTVTESEKEPEVPAAKPDNGSEKEDVKEEEAKEATGTYMGQVDNNFIELKLDGADSPSEFNIEKVADSVKGLKEGTKVKITYTINENKQYILKSIEKAR